MAQAAIAAEVHQALDVHRDVAAQIERFDEAARGHALALATLEGLCKAGEPLGAELALLYKKGAFGALPASHSGAQLVDAGS